jgi:hypothetical protein
MIRGRSPLFPAIGTDELKHDREPGIGRRDQSSSLAGQEGEQALAVRLARNGSGDHCECWVKIVQLISEQR